MDDRRTERSLRYLMARACPPRLDSLLQAMAAEAHDQLPREARRTLAVRIGARMATAEPMVHADSLFGLQQGINTWLEVRGWGWVALHDHGEWLEVEHACQPLRSVLGDRGLEWASGLFEGLFATWLRLAGADTELQLRAIDESPVGDERLRYALAVPEIHAELTDA